MSAKAYLEITMAIDIVNRHAATAIYADCRQKFLNDINGAMSKDLMIREQDVQVFHEFNSVEHAQAYLKSEMFKNDVFFRLKSLCISDPNVRIYTVA